jgi:predicted dithiol-disulfide oxidoreductase (DUF899 family)
MAEPLHDMRFPGESDEYREARNELLRAEIELRRSITRVAEQRRSLPLGGELRSDYTFDEWDPGANAIRQTRLSELFEDGKDTLYLYSFMIVPAEQGLPFVGPCPSCTSIIDAMDGQAQHITQRINFAVVAKEPLERFREHAAKRGWRNARLLASDGTYSRDYGAEDANGYQWPLANVFVRRDGKIHHFWNSELWFVPHDEGQGPRHVDYMWPLWAVFDRTPTGRDPDWNPQIEYQ